LAALFNKLPAEGARELSNVAIKKSLEESLKVIAPKLVVIKCGLTPAGWEECCVWELHPPILGVPRTRKVGWVGE